MGGAMCPSMGWIRKITIRRNKAERGLGGKKHYWKFVTSVQEKTRAALDTQKATENPQQVTKQTLKLVNFQPVGIAMEAMQSKPSTLTPTTYQNTLYKTTQAWEPAEVLEQRATILYAT